MITQVLAAQKPGPLPLRGSFTCLADDDLDLFLTGTASRKRDGGNASIVMKVKDKTGRIVFETAAAVYIGNHSINLPLVSQFKQARLVIGETYQWEIETGEGSGSYSDDVYSAVIIY